MKKITVTDSNGNLYVAKPATDYCAGCVFHEQGENYGLCNSPPETFCGGLIYEKATPADIDERNSWDKTALWLVLIVFALAIMATGFIIHSINKYNNQLL